MLSKPSNINVQFITKLLTATKQIGDGVRGPWFVFQLALIDRT
jgi:hypothetical protein